MLDGQWELKYPGTVLTLGSSPLLPPYLQRGYHHMSAPEIGAPELEVDDQRQPRGDGVSFGQDFRGGTLITFELGLRGTDQDDALTLSQELLRAWRGDAVRNTPGDVATLCTSNLGRLRMCYGRPRRASTQHTAPRSALMLGTVDFQTVDDLWYDADVSSIVVPIAPPPTGGVTFPATFPILFAGAATTYGAVNTEGTLPAWPIIKITGPIANPIVSLQNGWSLQLNMSILAGQTVTIDTRPWVRSITTGSSSYAGKLSRTSRLDKAFLKPNTNHTVSLRGTDPSGTSKMTFTWYNTYAGI